MSSYRGSNSRASPSAKGADSPSAAAASRLAANLEAVSLRRPLLPFPPHLTHVNWALFAL